MIEEDIKRILELSEYSREHKPQIYTEGINKAMKGHEPRNYRNKEE